MEQIVTGLQFCTTDPHGMLELDEGGRRETTAPESAFGERHIGYLPSRGHEVPCEPTLRGYIHGEVERLAGFDIPRLCQGEILVDREEPVELSCVVWAKPDQPVDCIAVIWPNQEFVCWRGDSGTTHLTAEEAYSMAEVHRSRAGADTPEVRVEQVFRYYIVAEDDESGLAHARKQAAERSRML